MTHLSEFERRAWESRSNADKHLPAMAMKATLDKIERGEIKPKHVIVVYVEDDGQGGDFISMVQAGTLSQLGTEGALGRGIKLSQNSE